MTTFMLPNGLLVNNPETDNTHGHRSPGLPPLRMVTLNPAKMVSVRSIDTLIWSIAMLRVTAGNDLSVG